MKLLWPLILFFAVAVSASWTKEDYEIFTLNDKVRSDLGADVTFYSWLDLKRGSKSSQDEINKAYRKLSRNLHPDKFRTKSKSAKKKAEERFQTLSAVGNVLKDRHLKKRYDYFLSNGFPRWKGTGYYYSRFRPGIALTLFFIYLLVSSFHYVSLRISRSQDFKRIVALKEEIVNQAWNGSIVPPSDGSARKIRAASGKEFHVSPVGEVSLVGKNSKGEMVLELLDEYDINTKPGFAQSYFVKFPAGIWNLTVGKLTGYSLVFPELYENPKRKQREAIQARAVKSVSKQKTAKRGPKTELPNGKVIYGRKSGKKE